MNYVSLQGMSEKTKSLFLGRGAKGSFYKLKPLSFGEG
jgi:hypothetical protein